jgi:hypothetical protein
MRDMELKGLLSKVPESKPKKYVLESSNDASEYIN